MQSGNGRSEQEQTRTVWAPQAGRQHALIKAPHPLIGYGGARGGGKTDGVLGKMGLNALRYGKGYNTIFFRRAMPQADDLIERAREIYCPVGAEWYEQKKLFLFNNGARIRFRPLENDVDAEKYQGQNLTAAAVEEAGNYSDPAPIWKLFGALRSVGGVPIQLILTFNPGGPGHRWLRETFVKPAPLGMKTLYKVLPTGKKIPYVYIPSTVKDNKILLQKDPEYINRLHLVGSPELVRAWLEGDFEITEGSYFPEFGQRHIVAPFPIPKHWTRYLGYDWGYASPFCALWGAVSSGKDDSGKEVPYPKGSVVIYRELWGKRVENVDQAQKIAKASSGEEPICVADPAIFSEQGGPSIADQFARTFTEFKHPVFRPADNERLSGWSQIRQRLMSTPAMLFVSTACPYLLDSLPNLQHDQGRPEDVDTTGDDHAADALRYLCKARLLETDHKKVVERSQKGTIQLSEYISSVRNQQGRSKI